MASTPITLLEVTAAAGFTAGSMPTKVRCGWSERSRSMAAAVAVLQASTMTSAPCVSSQAVMVDARSMMNSGGRSPYGACP